ncbi:hypothetical protein BJF93_03615 [Xaviernesmea oryzae]|uniref:Acyltransferase 3 domain-containing protein n=1 Tax=Xaviernesmea oryzae TaxID=464029 RepID=A0A1Q9AU81_9HYPH|nr:acyltransferase [Xaviernesmea oryzae]OLP59027.1 hypothetical protein BJF93_03615 [Xaviernesmea oryzae]SEK90015.1 exopolysaccharide production protein ExoZ [Xaviernesmea oryzae]
MTASDATIFKASTTRRELVSIQYLRAVAALSVLITHTLQWPLPEENWFLLKTGRFGVDIFFVISGFIITVIAGRGRFDPLRFASRRIMRIIPPYWAATLLVTVLALAMPNQFRTTVPDVESFIKSLLFIPSQDPKAPLLNLGWTLNYEAFFYALFACSFFLTSGWRTVAHVVILGGLMLLGNAHEFGFVAGFYTSGSLMGFIFGTLVAQAYLHGLIQHVRGPVALLLAILALVLCPLYYWLPWESIVKAPLYVHFILSLMSSLVVTLFLGLELQDRLPTVAPMKLLGDASYSIYLFHLFPLGAYWAVGKRVFDVTSVAIYLPLALIGIAVTLTFGLLCYFVFEKPFLDLYKRRRAPVPA